MSIITDTITITDSRSERVFQCDSKSGMAERHNSQRTEIRVRRVTPQDRPEHIQVQITVTNWYDNTSRELYGHMSLTPEQAELLVEALQTPNLVAVDQLPTKR